MTTGSQLQSQLARSNQVLTFSRSDTQQQPISLNQGALGWNTATVLGNSIYVGTHAFSFSGGGGTGAIHKQTNGAGNFEIIPGTDGLWQGMATLGNNVYAARRPVGSSTGQIFMQTGGEGSFVSLNQPSRQYYGMTSLGNKVYVCVNGGDIFVQTGETGDFVALGQTSRNWFGMATLGNNVYATVTGGDIYVQTGGVGNFTPLNQTSRNWSYIVTLGNDVYATSDFNSTGLSAVYKQTGGVGNFNFLFSSSGFYPFAALGNDLYFGSYASNLARLTILPDAERIFNFTGHNLQTGDQVFQTSSSPMALAKKFVIRINADSFKFATTSQNAINGVSELTPTQFPPLQTRISTDLGRTMTDFSTTPFINSSVWRRSSFDASARSTVGFSINTPVAIDWTYPATSLSALNSLSNIVGLSTEDEATIFAILCPPRTTNSQFLIASPSSTLVQTVAAVTGVTNISGHKGRITITSERRITFQIATLTGTTYTPVWTSEIQAASLPLLYFYTTFCYSQERIIDCKITYL
jgi:hypothetical protein